MAGAATVTAGAATAITAGAATGIGPAIALPAAGRATGIGPAATGLETAQWQEPGPPTAQATPRPRRSPAAASNVGAHSMPVLAGVAAVSPAVAGRAAVAARVVAAVTAATNRTRQRARKGPRSASTRNQPGFIGGRSSAESSSS